MCSHVLPVLQENIVWVGCTTSSALRICFRTRVLWCAARATLCCCVRARDHVGGARAVSTRAARVARAARVQFVGHWIACTEVCAPLAYVRKLAGSVRPVCTSFLKFPAGTCCWSKSRATSNTCTKAHSRGPVSGPSACPCSRKRALPDVEPHALVAGSEPGRSSIAHDAHVRRSLGRF